MTFQISFGHCHSYDAREGLAIRAVLIASGRDVSCIAYIDTGASVCLFQRELADTLELDLETGHRINLSTLTGSLPAYGHEVTLQTLDVALHTTVYFASTPGLQRNLLGRAGWLHQLKLGIVDHDEFIYLSHYDDEA